MRFEFATAGRIIFGSGTFQEVAQMAVRMGQRAMVVTGKSPERAQPLVEQLQAMGVETMIYHVPCEPTTEIALAGVRMSRGAQCDLVIGLGGGSVLDTGKVIAALLTNGGDLMDYLEIIGGAKAITLLPAPYIAIPTTAGTGAEVASNAVLASPEHQVKVSMRSPLMLPGLAVIDPLLTLTMPPSITASTGLDALTQLMEPFVSNKANPITDGICREGLKRAALSLYRAYENGEDRQAREDMSLASLFGGLALANAKLGAVHGIAGPMGGMIPAPHGVICARLLPHVMEVNVRALKMRAPGSPALTGYDEIARILTGKPSACAADGIAWVQELCQTLNIPALFCFGLREIDFPAVVEKAQKASSMKGNPIELTAEELTQILQNESR